MAHISQKKVSKKVLKKITNQFFDSIYKQNKSSLQPFLLNILTDTEEIMLAKRLAVIAMLIDSISYYKIQKVLKVSTSTAIRLRNNLLEGEYSDIERWFKKEKNKEAFWLEMETVFRMGMPEMGRGRWKFLNEYLEKKKAK